LQNATEWMLFDLLALLSPNPFVRSPSRFERSRVKRLPVSGNPSGVCRAHQRRVDRTFLPVEVVPGSDRHKKKVPEGGTGRQRQARRRMW